MRTKDVIARSVPSIKTVAVNHRLAVLLSPKELLQTGRRFLRWRLHGLRRRLRPATLNQERRVRIDDDVWIWVRLADIPGTLVYVYGTTEFFGTTFLREVLQPGWGVVDVGANIGEYTLLAAKRVGPSGAVIAIEPAPGQFRLLARSVSENGFQNVRLFPVAVSDANEQALLYIPDSGNSGLARLSKGWGTAERKVLVECVRLDDLLAREQLARIDVIKVDVEGLEHDVLKGASATITSSRPIIIFEVNDIVRSTRGVTAPAIDWLRAHGYALYGGEFSANGRWALRLLQEGQDPAGFRDRWQHSGYPPNLVGLHPDHPQTEFLMKRLPLATDEG